MPRHHREAGTQDPGRGRPRGGGFPRCLIVDDTNLPKTGRRIELIGRVYSHLAHQSLLALDFSLHGEKGKNKKCPQGISAAQAKKRYSKKRAPQGPGGIRQGEYDQGKIMTMISMVPRAISKGIRFEYLLVDSWFTCHEPVWSIKTRRIPCHLLGMIKMGTTKYLHKGEERTAKQIVDLPGRGKGTKRSRATGLHMKGILARGAKLRNGS